LLVGNHCSSPDALMHQTIFLSLKLSMILKIIMSVFCEILILSVSIENPLRTCQHHSKLNVYTRHVFGFLDLHKAMKLLTIKTWLAFTEGWPEICGGPEQATNLLPLRNDIL
jgi:hypothetical protein